MTQPVDPPEAGKVPVQKVADESIYREPEVIPPPYATDPPKRVSGIIQDAGKSNFSGINNDLLASYIHREEKRADDAESKMAKLEEKIASLTTSEHAKDKELTEVKTKLNGCTKNNIIAAISGVIGSAFVGGTMDKLCIDGKWSALPVMVFLGGLGMLALCIYTTFYKGK
jgi:hypothetical protein